MLVSLQWIKKYVELPDHLSGDEIAHTLTLATVEVESAERLAARFDRITVGKVTAVSPHPKADRLRIVGRADTDLLREFHQAWAWVDVSPPSPHGRIELLRWVREQAVSQTLHRHGRLTST